MPPGATLHSLATFLHRSCGSKNTDESCLRIYGVSKDRLGPGNPTGQGAKHLADKFFGGTPSGVELIRHHTLLGLYGPAMSKGWWGNRFLASLAEGVTAHKFAMGHRFGKPLSWCPVCCQEDFSRFGWAPWRVVHQVPFAHHCPYHGTNLLTGCSACHEPLDLGFHWRLPGDACRKCNGRSFRPAFSVDQSPGYQRLLRVLAALNGTMMSRETVATIRDSSWAGERPSLSIHLQMSFDQLSTAWALLHPERTIPQLLGTREKPEFLQTALRWPELASPLAVLLLASLQQEFTGKAEWRSN